MVDAPGDLLSAHQEKQCRSATNSVSAYKEYELSVVSWQAVGGGGDCKPNPPTGDGPQARPPCQRAASFPSGGSAHR